MTGEDDEPAKLSHAIAKAIENMMMMMIRAQTSDLDMSAPDRSDHPLAGNQTAARIIEFSTPYRGFPYMAC